MSYSNFSLSTTALFIFVQTLKPEILDNQILSCCSVVLYRTVGNETGCVGSTMPFSNTSVDG